MNIAFEPNTHTYTDRDTGEILPSVTQILQDVEIIDTGIFAPGAAEFGSMVHKCLERIDKGLVTGESFEGGNLEGYVTAYARFKRDADFEIRAVEKVAAHEQYRYAGTIDRIGVLNGRECIIDLKSGRECGWHRLQLAAYSLLAGSDKRRLGLYLKNTGANSLVEYSDRQDESTFLSALNVYRWKRRHV